VLNRGCTIADTAHRGISLDQLHEIEDHMRTRIASGERWVGQRPNVTGRLVDFMIESPDQVNLYDMNEDVIKVVTKHRRCAMVEVLAAGEQLPDYFVSHFWGEAITQFNSCLRAHTKDRGLQSVSGYYEGILRGGLEDQESKHAVAHPGYLGGRSPIYWVCAHANRQHSLASEITFDLEQTSFYRAMRLSRGTVLVVDDGAVCFSRIWVIFELYESLVVSFGGAYTTDIYSSHSRGQAVGIITNGLGAVDETAGDKYRRERSFPTRSLLKGLHFNCREG
jgi:hypothetical protein